MDRIAVPLSWNGMEPCTGEAKKWTNWSLYLQQKAVSLTSSSLLLVCVGYPCPESDVALGCLSLKTTRKCCLLLQNRDSGFLVDIGIGVMQGIPYLPYHLCCKYIEHSKVLFMGVLGQLDPCSVLAAPKNGAEDHLLRLF